jgi:hypothetical protein
VVARGLGCIPILEIRERMSSGQAAARLAVYQDVNEERAEYDTAPGKATLARGHGATPLEGGVANSWLS